MSVATTASSIAYVGNAATVAFPTTFPFFSASDLVVTVTPSGGNPSTLVLGVGYTVSGGAGSTGTVTMTAAPANNAAVLIKRATPATQPTALPAQGPFSSSTVEKIGDRAALVAQETEARTTTLEVGLAATNASIAGVLAAVAGGFTVGNVGFASHAASAGAYTPVVGQDLQTAIALDANITVNVPVTAISGARVTHIFTQDATGGRKVTFGAGYIGGAQFQARSGPGQQSTVTFVKDAGGNWVRTTTDGVDLNREFRLEDYGCLGDATQDDLSRINLCLSDAVAAGGTVFVRRPSKAYRITGQMLAGIRFVTEGDIQLGKSDYTAAPSYNSTNHTAALTLNLIDVVGEPGAVFWCDFAPSIDTAALYYGICQSSNKPNASLGSVRNLTFLAREAMSLGGTFNAIAGGDALANTHHIGVFAAGTTVKIEDISTQGIARPVVQDSCYSGVTRRIHAWRCFEGVMLNNCNAIEADNFLVNYGKRHAAVVISGQGLKVGQIVTEECQSGLWVTHADQIGIDGRYFESISNGSTDWAVKFGFQKWATATAYVAGTVPSYVNRSGKTYVCKTAGTSINAPTGTGTGITDAGSTCVWDYVADNNSPNQVIFAHVEDLHGTQTSGKHLMLAETALLAINCRLYVSSGASLTWLDDTVSSLVRIHSNLPVDPACPGVGQVSDFSASGIVTQGGLLLGASAADLTGAGLSARKMGSENEWYDSSDGTLRWKHGVPSDQHDGNSIAPVGNTQTWGSFPSTNTMLTATTTLAWSGVKVGDALTMVPVSIAATLPTGVLFYAYVSATDTVTLVCFNGSSGTFNPSSFTYNLSLWHVKY